MGSGTDAKIAGWQKEAGIEPASGARAEALGELSRQAYELIRIIELERSGIRDGDGTWYGSNALEGTIDNLNRCWPPLSDDGICPRCGVHMQATHHPACAARDGTPIDLADELTEVNGKPAITERWSKEGLLAHYATREPKSFVQFDGWYGGKWAGDSVIATDETGRSMTSGLTTELMCGADMRLLIEPGAAPNEIVALLNQAAEWITRSPDILDSSHWHDSKLHLVEPSNDNTEIDRIRNKLDTALKSTGYGWGTSLGDLVGGELTDMLKDGRADDEIEWMRAAQTKFDQYCRCL